MDGQPAKASAMLMQDNATPSREWMQRVISLIESAVSHLPSEEHPAQGALVQAARLLRRQVCPIPPGEVPYGKGRLLPWQERKLREYIDNRLPGRVRVADLCALVQRSEGHFSRSFRLTFGEPPHSFVVRRRVELAAEFMLTTNDSLSDIALQCGFTDQAHLCKQFRHAVGETPAAWRRRHMASPIGGIQA